MRTLLQVAIGICFVFLLFRLIVSAANELVQAMLSMRAAPLKAGIGELLQDRKFPNAAKEFCNPRRPQAQPPQHHRRRRSHSRQRQLATWRVWKCHWAGQIPNTATSDSIGGVLSSDGFLPGWPLRCGPRSGSTCSIALLTSVRPADLPMKTPKERNLKRVIARARRFRVCH